MPHPLDYHLDPDAEGMLDDFKDIVIPDDKEERDLDLIIELALDKYREIGEILEFIEPKNKIKYLEMQRDFLAQAKDARFKRDRLILEREKLEKMKGSTKSKSQEDNGDSTEASEPTVSRKELQERMRRVK